MQDLRIILIILGAVAIAALLIHGLWTSQKGRQKPMRDKPMGKVNNKTLERTDDPFDSDGIGKVRVVDSHQAASLSRDHEIDDDWQISPHFSAMNDDDSNEPSISLPPTLSSSVFAEDPDDETNQAPDFSAQSALRAGQKSPKAPKYTAAHAAQANALQTNSAQASRQPAGKARPTTAGRESAAEQRARQYRQGEIDPLFDNHQSKVGQSEVGQPEPRQPEYAAAERRQSVEQVSDVEPVIGQVAASQTISSAPLTDIVEPLAAEPTHLEPAVEPVIAQPVAPVTKTWQDVYVISLVAKPNQTIAGTDLMRAVTEVGFTFGEMDIFHRYQGSSSQGEALFSLANMVNPGTFTPDAMSEFTTPGVSIFMQLPKPGMAKNNFNLMIQAASNMAEDLDAVLLDGKRQALGLDYLVRCRSQLNDFDSQA